MVKVDVKLLIGLWTAVKYAVQGTTILFAVAFGCYLFTIFMEVLVNGL